MSQQKRLAIGEYLLARLKQLGTDHIFGVPGDFILEFLDQVEESKVKWVGTCTELNAAYAADGYARIKGIGALAVTFGVGELTAINGVAGAFAESVPVVVVAGHPTRKAIAEKPMIHHSFGDYTKTLEMFKSITVAQAVLTDPKTAAAEIDRVLGACLTLQKPVYISVPQDMAEAPLEATVDLQRPIPLRLPSVDPAALSKAVHETLEMLNSAKRPAIVADMGLLRLGLERDFATFINKSGLPFATLMVAKGVMDESHRQCIGLYQKARSRQYVKDRIEQSDCVIQFGAMLTNYRDHGGAVRIETDRLIVAARESVFVRDKEYKQVPLEDFLSALNERIKSRDAAQLDIRPASKCSLHTRHNEHKLSAEKRLSENRLYDRLSHFLSEKCIVIADTGTAMWSAAEMLLPRGSTFIAQTFYESIGYTIGATLGLCLAAPKRNVLTLIGDGAFQETCQDLSTMIRHKVKPMIFLINNGGYLVERLIRDSEYNDLQPWQYHLLPEVFGGSKGYNCRTEGELEEALINLPKSSGFQFVEIHLPKMDASQVLLFEQEEKQKRPQQIKSEM